jgi:putative transposase
MRATSRCRCGIESSYRQAQQARMRTRSRQPALRLLFVGVAFGLRHVWGWWQAAVMAQPQRGARQLRPQALRFARVLLWLRMEVARHYRLLRNMPVYHDFYERAQAFGIVFNY